MTSVSAFTPGTLQHCSKKSTLVLSHLDSSHANCLRRAMLITTDKIPKVFEQQNVTERAVTPLSFEKAEGATEAPDTLLIKSTMGTSKTKALVDYLNSNQVPKDARVVIISFHKSFTSELHKNIGPDFVDYQTVEGEIDKPKIIVQYESLGWLKICNLDKTTLILYEAKSILRVTTNK